MSLTPSWGRISPVNQVTHNPRLTTPVAAACYRRVTDYRRYVNDTGVFHQGNASGSLTVWKEVGKGRGRRAVAWRTSGAGSREPVRTSEQWRRPERLVWRNAPFFGCSSPSRAEVKKWTRVYR